MSGTSEAAAERVRELMERIAVASGVEATVEVHDGDDGLHAEFVGDDLGLLIGHHGQTIDAIQHLAYRFAGRGDGERISVLVDAAGYRERRAVALDAMSALERKVIHEHLKDRHDVETYSEGQEPSRYLVVAPLVD